MKHIDFFAYLDGIKQRDMYLYRKGQQSPIRQNPLIVAVLPSDVYHPIEQNAMLHLLFFSQLWENFVLAHENPRPMLHLLSLHSKFCLS